MEPYGSIEGKARILVQLLYVGAGLDALAVVFDVMELSLLHRLNRGAEVSSLEVAAALDRYDSLAMARAVLFAVTAAVFVAWFLRAYRNLAALGATTLPKKAGWAVAAWFIPLYNLWGPRSLAGAIAVGSDPAARPRLYGEWHERPAPAFLNVWWGLWIALVVLSGNVSGAAPPRNVGGAVLRGWEFLVTDVVAVAATIAAAVFVRRITQRQSERARRLGLTDGRAVEPRAAASTLRRG